VRAHMPPEKLTLHLLGNYGDGCSSAYWDVKTAGGDAVVVGAFALAGSATFTA
jgi:hypothetical protein